MVDDVRLGQKVGDKLTDFEGIVIAKADNFAGCTTVKVTPEETGLDAGLTETMDTDRVTIEGNGRMDEVPETNEELLEKIELGQRVRDPTTGVEGIATLLTEYAFTAPQVTVQPNEPSADGSKATSRTVDVTQVEIVGDGILDKRKAVVDGLDDPDTGPVGSIPDAH